MKSITLAVVLLVVSMIETDSALASEISNQVRAARQASYGPQDTLGYDNDHGAPSSGNLFGQMGDTIVDFVSGRKGAPLSLGNLDAKPAGKGSHHHHHDHSLGAGSRGGPSATAREVNKSEEKNEGEINLFGNDLSEWVKLIFNPVELAKSISKHFNLDFTKFSELIGKGLIFGVEAMLQPLMVTLKIVEKVFVPDACRLRFMCKMGTHLEFIKSHVVKFSPSFLEGSSQLRAFSDGIIGRDCDSAFPNCAEGEPKLKKSFEELKHGGGSNGYGGSSFSANIQEPGQSLSIDQMDQEAEASSGRGKLISGKSASIRQKAN